MDENTDTAIYCILDSESDPTVIWYPFKREWCEIVFYIMSIEMPSQCHPERNHVFQWRVTRHYGFINSRHQSFHWIHTFCSHLMCFLFHLGIDRFEAI